MMRGVRDRYVVIDAVADVYSVESRYEISSLSYLSGIEFLLKTIGS